MKARILYALLFISTLLAPVVAQARTTASGAHAQAHRQQLANVSKMNRSVIMDMVSKDLQEREEAENITPENDLLVNDLLKEANRHIGKRYVRGAKGPSQFDCSGFSSYVYRQFGYTLSPSSRAQYTQGTPVDRKTLRKGDLVFFTSRSSGKNVGHVGIVVSADNETGAFSFIHASIKGVKIDKCEGYYAARYIGARRVIE